jgi:hypothetical protein
VGWLERLLERREKGSGATQAELVQWHRVVGYITKECEHTPTLRRVGRQLLMELRGNSVDEEIGLVAERDQLAADRAEARRKEIELRIELRRLELGSKAAGAERRRTGLGPDAAGEAEGRHEEPRTEAEKVEEKIEELVTERKRLDKEEWRLDKLLRSAEMMHYGTLLTRDDVISRIGAEARLHYRYLWSHCTVDEKLVLLQLATHGLVNPKYFGWVMDLMNRGLIVRAPDLRLMNDSFKRFILQEVRRSEILEWQEEIGPSAWSVLKWLLPLPLLLLAGFLFITQRDAVSNVAGVLVALASLAPVVFNLYGKFQEVNVRRMQQESVGGE